MVHVLGLDRIQLHHKPKALPWHHLAFSAPPDAEALSSSLLQIFFLQRSLLAVSLREQPLVFPFLSYVQSLPFLFEDCKLMQLLLGLRLLSFKF